MADQQQWEPQPSVDSHAEDDSRGDEESGSSQKRDTMGETVHPGEESPSSQEVPQSKEAGGEDSGKSAENLRSPDSKMAGDQSSKLSSSLQMTQLPRCTMFIGDKPTNKNWRRDRAAESGDSSEPDGDKEVQEDKNGAGATNAQVSYHMKPVIDKKKMKSQRKSKIPIRVKHGVAKSPDNTQNSYPGVISTPRDNAAEAAGASSLQSPSESPAPQGIVKPRPEVNAPPSRGKNRSIVKPRPEVNAPPSRGKNRSIVKPRPEVNAPPSSGKNRSMLSIEHRRNRGSSAGTSHPGMQDNKNICNENLLETRTTFKKRVADQGWDCSESLDSLLQRLKDHKKEQRFYRLGVRTRDVSHHASYGGLYEALKEVDEQEVEAIRTQKQGNVHDSAAKYFIDDLAQSQFRVGHLVVYFCDDHHHRADIVRLVAEFHRDCPTCSPFFKNYF